MLKIQAYWNDNCTFTYPIWAEFSNDFTTPNMRFGEIDIQINENVAKQYQVNLSGLVGQLPCLILFEDGKEKLRFPPIDMANGKYARVTQYKAKELIKYFDLDKRYVATRSGMQGINES